MSVARGTLVLRQMSALYVQHCKYQVAFSGTSQTYSQMRFDLFLLLSRQLVERGGLIWSCNLLSAFPGLGIRFELTQLPGLYGGYTAEQIVNHVMSRAKYVPGLEPYLC